MRKKILLGLLGLVVVAVGLVSALALEKPDRFHAERRARIDAPRATVVALITDLHAWERWSPWRDLDPNQRITYRGAASGVGAGFSWQGNDQVGRGEMDLVAVDDGATNTDVDFRLHFLEPFESRAEVRFSVRDRGPNAVEVTWAMDSEASFPSKVMDVFADMDAMIGRDFERGLARLAEVATGRR